MKNIFLQLLAITLITSPICVHAQKNWLVKGNTGTNPATDFLGTIDGNPVVFRTNNIEKMRIQKSGKVGIGTADPAAKLNIVSDSYVTLSNAGHLVLGDISSYNMGFDYDDIQARNAGGSGPLYLNYYGGAVWIGSHNGGTSPAIYAAATGATGIGGSATQNGYALTVNPFSSGGAIYVNDPGNGYVLYSNAAGNATEALRINLTSTSNPYSAIRGTTSGNGYGVLAEANGSAGFGIEGYSTHSFGLWAGTGNSSTYAAYISGDLFVSGSYLGSDEKLKQNIQDFSSAMQIIEQLHPRLYKFRQDGYYKLMNLPQGEHYGLIAQDVEKVLPNLIKETKFVTSKAIPSQSDALKNAADIDFKALNYTELIPIIIKGMQELQTVNDKQEQQIKEQQKQIETLIQIISANNSSASNLSDLKNAYLLQNTPNPFNQNASIRCYVPSSAKQAQLAVYNMNGQLLKSFTLNAGTNDVAITAGTLSSGQYSYSLLVDGRKVDSKNMTITK